MIQFFKTIFSYWPFVAFILFMIFIFSITNGISDSIRTLKYGVKNATTPLGATVLVIVMIVLIILAIFIISKIKSLTN